MKIKDIIKLLLAVATLLVAYYAPQRAEERRFELEQQHQVQHLRHSSGAAVQLTSNQRGK